MSWGLPLLAALFAWWAGTLAVLLLARTRGRARRLALVGSWAVALLVLPLLLLLRPMDSVGAVYLGFATGLVLWGWQELLFLQGVAIGPRRTPSRPDREGLARVQEAVEAIAHHEIWLFAVLGVLGVLAWGATLPVALLTFGLLWAMRLSAKLNLFYGVPYPNGHLFPPRVRHLASFLGRPRRSSFLLVSLVGWAGLATWLFLQGLGNEAPGTSTAFFLLSGLTALGALEHLAFLFHFPLEGLWRWEEDAEVLDAPVDGDRPGGDAGDGAGAPERLRGGPDNVSKGRGPLVVPTGVRRSCSQAPSPAPQARPSASHG